MTYPALLTMVKILQRGIPAPFGDHLEPCCGQCIYKALLHEIAIHYYHSTILLQHSCVAGDHVGILLHRSFITLLFSSNTFRRRLCCLYFRLGGFDVISHVVPHINERQHACFQALLCPLMSAIPELVYAGSVLAGFGQESGIESQDTFLLLQGTVQGIKQLHKGQWLCKLLPDSSVRVPSIAAQG